MGKSDTYNKDILELPEYFADTVNNGLFGGEAIVNPDELKELDPTELSIVEDRVKRIVAI